MNDLVGVLKALSAEFQNRGTEYQQWAIERLSEATRRERAVPFEVAFSGFPREKTLWYFRAKRSIEASLVLVVNRRDDKHNSCAWLI